MRKIDDRTGTKTSTEISVTGTEKKLLVLIRDNPAIILNEMAASGGLSRSGVRSLLIRQFPESF